MIDQDRHDDRGRPRPALQHLRPQDAQGAQRRHPRLRPAQYAGQGEEANAGWPYLNPSLAASSRLFSELNSRHAAARALHRRLLAARHRPRRPPRRPRRPRRPPRHHHRRDRPPEAGAVDGDRRPARLHAPRQHDLRQPARHARRPHAARRRLQAGGQEAAPVPRRAAPAGARRAPDAARPLAPRPPPGRRQRPDRADEACGAAARRRRRRRSSATASSATAPSRPRPRRSRSPRPSSPTRAPTRPTCTGWFDDFSHSGVYDALGGASRAGAPRQRVRATSTACLQAADRAGAARARRSRTRRRCDQRNRCPGADPSATAGRSSRPPTSPATRRRCRRGREARVLLVILVRGRRRRRLRSRAGAGANPDKRQVLGRVRQRVRPRQGRRREGRRRARGQDHRAAGSTEDAPSTRSSASRSTKNGFGSLRSDAFCESRPQSLIGEYFVDCQPGTAEQELKPGARSRSSTPPRRSRPTSSTTSCAAPTASACASSSTSSAPASAATRRQPQRRDPPRQPGAARDRPGAGDPRRARTRILADLTRNADTVDRRPRRQPQGRRALGHRGQARPRRPRPSAAPTSPPASSDCRPSCASCGRRWPRSAQAADAQTPALRNLDASAEQLDDASSTTSARSPTPRGRPSARSASASQTGDRAVNAAAAGRSPSSTRSRKGTPELAKNLAIILEHLDDRKHAVEKDPRSPGRPGLHRPRGAAAVRLRPDDLAINSSIRTATSSRSTLFVGRAPTTPNERDAARRTPSRERQLRLAPRPEPARHQLPRPDRRAAPARGARPRAAQARRRQRRPAAASRPGAGRRRRRARRRPRPPRRRRSPRRPPRRRSRRRPPEPPPVDLPPLPGTGGGPTRAAPAPLPPLPERQRDDQQRPAGADPAPRLPARPMKRAADQRIDRRQPRARGRGDRARASSSRSSWPTTPTTACRSCPTRELKVRVANGAEPGQGQRGALGRLPHRRRRRHDAGQAARRQGRRRAHAQARQEDRRGARRLDGRHPPALGARPEVRRARHRALEEGVRRRRRRARRADAVPVELDEFFNMFDEPRRARASQDNLQGFGDAFAGRGADLDRDDRGARRAASVTSSRSWRNLPTRHRAAGVLQGARRRRADRRAGLEAPTRTCSPRWPTPSRRSRATRRRCKDTIAKSPPTLDAAIASFRVQRPFLDDTDRVLARLLGATPRAARRAADAQPALEIGTPVQRRSVAAQRRPRRTRSARSRTSSRRPTTAGALRGLTATVSTLNPQLRFLRPVRDGLQHPELLLDLPRRALLRARRHRLVAARAAQLGRRRSRTDALGSMGANESANGKDALHRQRRAVPARQPLRRRPIDARRQRRLRGRPARLRRRPTTRCATRASRATRTRTPSTERIPIAGASGPTYAQYDREGKGVGLNPEHVPAGETFTDRPGGHGVDIARPSAMRRKQRKGMSPVAAGLLALVVLVRRSSTSASPSRSRSSTTTRSRPRSRRRTTSARARRCGSPASTSARSPSVERASRAASRRAVVTMRIDKQGPADPHATRRSRSARASSSRATSSSTSARARRRRRSSTTATRSRQPDQRAGPARPGPDRAAVRHARGPQALLREYVARACKGAGAQGFNRSIPYWKPAYRDSARSSPTRCCGTQRARPLGLHRRAPASTAAALDRNREQLKSLITDFNTTAGAFAARGPAALEPRSPSCRARCAPRCRRSRAQRARSRPCARFVRDAAARRVRSSGPAIDAAHAVRQAAARPRLPARAARPRRRPAPDGAGAGRAQPARGAALRRRSARPRAARTR